MSLDDDMPMGDGDAAPQTAAGPPSGWRGWFSGRRGWVILVVVGSLQAVFASVMISLRGVRHANRAAPRAEIQRLAVDMLGREIGISGINQVITGSRKRRITVGLDLVLVLGQLPEERIEGAPKPTDMEMDAFSAAVSAMDPMIRSRMITLLQGVDYDDYGKPEILERFKADVMDYVNDRLEQLDFSAVRPVIGKRRVTEALLPMFVRQPF